MRRSARRAKPFSPSKEQASVLDARTVGRDDVLALLDQRLRSLSTSRNRPHTLLVGPRGAGKTHLLEVSLHRAMATADFAEKVAVVRLDEDLVGVPRLVDLQREILRRLDPSRRDADNLANAIASALDGRTLLLVVENVDRLFTTLREAGQQDFRGWVETSGQICVLATAPLLFGGVRDRNLPWYGSFGITHLDELSLEDGRALLERRAQEDDDVALLGFLGSERGVARLRAVNVLAGGSPRIWMILSDVITVDLLDEVAPAVEALLEGLVPYYQQLLWDLSPMEQLVVRTLADGSDQAMTVSELAGATGTEQRSLATMLGRLVESRWLRAEKPNGVDKRLTYYRLREPMLRHHLRYRARDEQPLPLIVELLRAWFDLGSLRHEQRRAAAGSDRERTLSISLALDPFRADALMTDRDPDDLLSGAKSWITTERVGTDAYEAGLLIEQCVALVREGEPAAREVAGRRRWSDPEVATRLWERHRSLTGVTEADAIGTLLDDAAGLGTIGARRVEFIAICWNASNLGWSPSMQRLETLYEHAALHSALRIEVAVEIAAAMARSGDTDGARARLEQQLSLDSGDLRVRNALAWVTATAGDFSRAHEMYTRLLHDQRAEAASDVVVLNTRNNLAWLALADNDPVSARQQFELVVADYTRLLGDDDVRTMRARRNLADAVGQAGDPRLARDILVALFVDRVRLLGSDRAGTGSATTALADWTLCAADEAGTGERLREAASALPATTPAGVRDLIEIEAASWDSRSGSSAAAILRLGNLIADARANGAPDRLPPLRQQLVSTLWWFRWSTTAQVGVTTDPATRTVRSLQAALAGDATARATLPTELVTILDDITSASPAEAPRVRGRP